MEGEVIMRQRKTRKEEVQGEEGGVEESFRVGEVKLNQSKE